MGLSGFRIIFDLDSTITAVETLPLAADRIGLDAPAFASDTARAGAGIIPYTPSLISRLSLLAEFPDADIAAVVASAPIHLPIWRFIARHRDICEIATSSLHPYVDRLLRPLLPPRAIHTSSGSLPMPLDKSAIVRRRQNQGFKIMFVGDAANDIPALRAADIPVLIARTPLHAARLLHHLPPHTRIILPEDFPEKAEKIIQIRNYA